jgi:hypothetical protein
VLRVWARHVDRHDLHDPRTWREKELGMKNYHAPENQPTRRILPIASFVALAAAFTAALPEPVHAHRVTRPRVPANIEAPAGNKVFLEGHAFGTQNYICLPSGSGFSWILFGPQATLFDDDLKQVITHFLSPNPLENDTLRATWQHSRDTSAVWARAIATSSDPNYVAPGAIPWLLLEVVGAEDGSTGGHKLTAATFIQRVNTVGGMAPSTSCTLSTEVGAKAFVPYRADYFFYKDTESNEDVGN